MSFRVLHVVECLGGGVLTSVLAMVEATPDLDHHLAVWPRRNHSDTGDDLTQFGSTHTLAHRPLRAIADLRHLVATLRPDEVHAHSSYAGLLVRVAGPRADIVYSPHCFAFERRDLSPVVREGVRLIERSLVRRTDVLAACSPFEATLATGLSHQRVVTVPNRPLDDHHLRAGFARPLRVITVGRIAPQKDWHYLITVKSYLEDVLGGRVEWEWLGGGDEEAEVALRDHGVHVTGWLPRSDVAKRLAEAQVYLHTAAWEAAPISILEAAAVGLPIAARGIATLVSLDVPGTGRTAADLAVRILSLRSPALWAAEQQRSLAFAASHTADSQREGLYDAYRHAPAELALR